MLKNLLSITVEEFTNCVLFNGTQAKEVSVSFTMPDGSIETIDLDMFQSCIRSFMDRGEPMNFKSLADNDDKERTYSFNKLPETLSTAYFAKNTGNGYVRVFRELSDPDFHRYYVLLFEVPNCSSYAIAEVWKKFKDKIILGDWLDLSEQETQALKLHFQTLSN